MGFWYWFRIIFCGLPIRLLLDRFPPSLEEGTLFPLFIDGCNTFRVTRCFPSPFVLSPCRRVVDLLLFSEDAVLRLQPFDPRFVILDSAVRSCCFVDDLLDLLHFVGVFLLDLLLEPPVAVFMVAVEYSFALFSRRFAGS